jgi:hypothetical protein
MAITAIGRLPVSLKLPLMKIGVAVSAVGMAYAPGVSPFMAFLAIYPDMFSPQREIGLVMVKSP